MIETGQQYRFADTNELLTVTNISVYWSALYQTLSGIVIYKKESDKNSDEMTAKKFTLMVTRRELVRIK